MVSEYIAVHDYRLMMMPTMKIGSYCSLNTIIKLLVIACLVSHLIVLQNTTKQMTAGGNGVSGLSSTTSYDKATATLLDLGLPIQVIGSSSTSTSTTTTIPNSTTTTPSSRIKIANNLSAYDLLQHYPTITLDELVLTNRNPKCKARSKGRKGVVFDHTLMESYTDYPTSITHPPQRKIPRIVHVTSKTRCMPTIIVDNLQRWRLPQHNFYIHDDDAVNKLLWETYWPEFPHLNLLRPCMISGAALADLWRYLVLYQYGGIYADIDSAPGHLFLNGSVIEDTDDAWFVVERIGTLSQYFMASSPKHPLMHLAVTVTLRRLLEVQKIGKQYVPFVTGPGALKESWAHFLYNYEDHKLAVVGEDVDGGGGGDAEDGAEPEGDDEAEEGGGGGDKQNDKDEEGDATKEGQQDDNDPQQQQRRRRLQEEEPPPPQPDNKQQQKTDSDKIQLMKQQLEEQLQEKLQQQQEKQEKEQAEKKNEKKKKKKKRKGIAPGVYTGMLGRQVTIAGTRRVSLWRFEQSLFYQCFVCGLYFMFSFILWRTLFSPTKEYAILHCPRICQEKEECMGFHGDETFSTNEKS